MANILPQELDGINFVFNKNAQPTLLDGFEHFPSGDIFKREIAFPDFLNELRTRDKVTIDCSLFAQLVLACAFPIDVDKYVMLFGIAGGAVACVTRRKKNKAVILAPPCDLYTMTTWSDCCAQWLIPHKGGGLLGMSSDGPMVLSVFEWHKRLLDGLFADLLKHLAMDTPGSEITTIMRKIENGEFNASAYSLSPNGLIDAPGSLSLAVIPR
jgi:hypothetical protein